MFRPIAPALSGTAGFAGLDTSAIGTMLAGSRATRMTAGMSPTTCFVSNGDEGSGGKVAKPRKISTAVPSTFAGSFKTRCPRYVEPETGREYSVEDFRKTFGASYDDFFRHAHGWAKPAEAEIVSALIASPGAAQSYYAQLQSYKGKCELEVSIRRFFNSRTPSEIVSFLFSPEAGSQSFSQHVWSKYILERLFKPDALVQNIVDEDSVRWLINEVFYGRIGQRYFDSLAICNEHDVPVIAGHQIVAFLMAIGDILLGCVPTELQDQITSYVSDTMSTEARATFESIMAENHLLTLAVEIAKAKQQQADPAASVCIAQKFIEMDASRDIVASVETTGSEVDLAECLGYVRALRLISQQRVKCSDPLSDLLPLYMGGLLEDDEMAQFEKHLLSCPTCYEEACWNLEFVANHPELPGEQEAGEALQALKSAWAERHPA